jgi:hypothetical protein
LTVDAAAINLHPSGLLLGQDQDAVDGDFSAIQSFAGDMATLRIYNRALSVSEINALYLETGWRE